MVIFTPKTKHLQCVFHNGFWTIVEIIYDPGYYGMQKEQENGKSFEITDNSEM